MFELRVLNGLQQGAALPLIGNQWSIGCAQQQDLVLDDTEVAPLHCVLQRAGEHWSIAPGQGPVLDAQGQPLAVPELSLNSVFSVGPVWLCVSPADDQWPAVPAVVPLSHDQNDLGQSPPLEKVEPRSRKRFPQAVGILAGVLIGVIGSAWSLSRTPGAASEPINAAGQPPAARIASPSASPAKIAPAAPGTTTRLADTEAVRRQLGSMLGDRLLTAVVVRQTSSGLVLEGTLDADAMQVYQRMLQRFKNSYSSPVTVLDKVALTGSSLPFTVVQIMTGPHAHLVTADGKRLYVGDELAGLRLIAIDEKHLRFEGEHPIEVAW